MLNNFEFKHFKEEIEKNYSEFISMLQNSSLKNSNEQSLFSNELNQSIKTPVDFNRLGMIHFNNFGS